MRCYAAIVICGVEARCCLALIAMMLRLLPRAALYAPPMLDMLARRLLLMLAAAMILITLSHAPLRCC